MSNIDKTKKCRLCNSMLKITVRHGIGYETYKCEKCGTLYYLGDIKSKMIIKDGIKYINLNA